MSKLNHLDADGAARMVDVSAKEATAREASAEALVRLSPEAYAAARRIADHGRIVTISSNTTTVPQVGVALYGTSKIAVSYLIRVMALELGARGVTVNTVVPGPIDNAGIFTDPSNNEYKQSLIDMIPIGRLGTPQDVAAITAFLASDDAGLITGQQIVADGGMH